MEAYVEWMRSRAAEKHGEAEALAADLRQDECDLAKVEENIFTACADAFGGLRRSFAGEELARRYLQLLEKMSGQWRASMEKAAEHDEVRKRIVEELKLKTLGEIRSHFGGEA